MVEMHFTQGEMVVQQDEPGNTFSLMYEARNKYAMGINGHQWPSMAMPCVEDGTGLTGSSLFQLRTLVPAPPRSCACRAMWTSSKTAKWLPIWR